jgi:hypothetical protein
MPDATTTELQGMKRKWRTFCLLIIAILQVLILRGVVRSFPRWDSWHLVVFALGTAGLFTTGCDIALKGKPTRLPFCFFLGMFAVIFLNGVVRIWNHDPGLDPAWTIFTGLGNIGLMALCILMNPFGLKKTSPAIIRKDFT